MACKLGSAAIVVAIGFLMGTAAHAQTGVPPTVSPGPPAVAGPVPPEQIAPRGTGSVGSSGVIRPPAGVDPGIAAPVPTPNVGTMPVIPPPGTPGGNPAVQPK